MNDNIRLEKITLDSSEDLAGVYREVFRGFPWYEDKVCSGARFPVGSSDRCSVQYTSRKLPEGYKWSLDSQKREGVVGEIDFNETLECTLCGRDLIEFYPDFIDQRRLIEEAIEKDGFIGVILRESERPTGFSWGYRIPSTRTFSVDFPSLIPELVKRGLDPKRTFYGAELGVIEEKQKRGLGLLASTARLVEANKQSYEDLLVRTKNEAVLSILRRIFSGREEEYLFDDPEKQTPLFRWGFRDFDSNEVKKIMRRLEDKV